MRYPDFYDMYRDAIRNTWTVEEVDFSDDLDDLARKLDPAERHLVHRLVAFFATGDSIVANNLVLNLYKHINAPEARLYLSRQLYEEALHVQFYLTLLDTYLPDMAEREQAFAAIEHIPSIRAKAEFCMRWMDSIELSSTSSSTQDDRRRFLLNLICFATCVEGLFFFAAFAYVYFFRSKGLLNGLASGTNWVFRDESDAHALRPRRWSTPSGEEEPDLFDAELDGRRAPDDRRGGRGRGSCSPRTCSSGGVSGPVRGRHPASTSATWPTSASGNLGMAPRYGARNPFDFMQLQDVQELSNFFERPGVRLPGRASPARSPSTPTSRVTGWRRPGTRTAEPEAGRAAPRPPLHDGLPVRPAGPSAGPPVRAGVAGGPGRPRRLPRRRRPPTRAPAVDWAGARSTARSWPATRPAPGACSTTRWPPATPPAVVPRRPDRRRRRPHRLRGGGRPARPGRGAHRPHHRHPARRPARRPLPAPRPHPRHGGHGQRPPASTTGWPSPSWPTVVRLAGYAVIELGTDVPADAFLGAITHARRPAGRRPRRHHGRAAPVRRWP